DDMTAQQEQAEALQNARETAETALKTRSDFLSMVSHEIRTPMNAIVNLTQSLAETPLNEQQRLYVDKVQGGVRMLLGLVNDLLDHARLEAGKLKVESIPMRLPEVITQVVTLYSA
ncbi:histidine kinase dimerization/phospho-acceptor domain-containing protein, partial [Arthrospira platensis SPKY1]|nr:histidine kinase dimerization/phospho-acceptor domain-containing protein [Arthrospira platensis SPKY1]